MVVVLLAAGGALIGLIIRGEVGAVTGAAIAALAGVAAGYVPVFRDRAEQRRAALEQAAADHAAAAAGLEAAREPRLEEPASGPSLLLRPQFGVVDFTGRVAELAALRAWCEAARPRSVRLLTGGGGVGKTRLALKVAGEWDAAGRTTVVVAAGSESGAVARARAVTSGPVLLIVDYAETRAGLGDLLRAVLDDPGPVRVLLVARSLGEWWDRLSEESSPAVAQLLSDTDPIGLQAPIDDIPDLDLAVSALACFAARLGAAVPAGVVFELPPQRAPVLVLHTAALVAVLRSLTSPPGPLRVAVTDGVLGELLEHEARYWRRSAASAGLTADGPVLKAVVAAAVLLGARDLAEAAAVAGRVPDLAGTPAGGLRQWARWLYGLYPAGPDGRLGSVQPDLLAEHHAVTQLAADPAVADAVLRGLTPVQADQALTVLARAWELDDRAGQVIEAALRADLARLAVPAADVAIQTSARVGVLLARALSDAPATVEELVAIEEELPYPIVTLAMADLAAAQRIRRELPPGTDRQTLARWASTCGLLLSQAGRPADALPPTQEAVATYRELAAALPDRYRPDLADALSDLGAWYSALGRPADALPPTEEAVAIRRELAAALPDRYRPDLADALSDLGVSYYELGRPADALPPTEEAVTTYRELAAALPDRYRPALARALTNLREVLARLGLDNECEAVRIEILGLDDGSPPSGSISPRSCV
jgi:tetratricopeptide (TPR) repeat protein